MRVRLCQFTTALTDGGIEERMARVVRGLDRAEFEPSWIAFGREANQALLNRAGGDVAWTVFPKRPGGIDLSVIPKIVQTLRRLKPDVLHVHNWSTGLYGILSARLAGVPVVIYGVGGREMAEGPTAKQRLVARSLAPYVDRYTTVCRFLAEELQEVWGIEPSAITLIPTGIDLRPFSATARAERRRELGIPVDAIVIGTTSADRPVKRLGDLFEAALEVAHGDPRVHVLWIGGGADNIYTAKARAAGVAERFHSPGRIENGGAYAPAFDVFVNTSDFEGTSNALLEAMAAEVTVVATNVGGTPDLIEQDRTGLLVPPRRPAALAQAFRRLVEDPILRARLGAEGAAKVREVHTTQRMVGQYRSLYTRVDRHRRSRPMRVARSIYNTVQALAGEAFRP